MRWKLNSASRRLLDATAEGCLLDVVLLKRRRIILCKAGRLASGEPPEFPGHQQIVEAGLIPERDVQGFSLIIRRRQIVSFNRTSILNIALPDYQLSVDNMDRILGEIGIGRAEDFQSFPEASARRRV